MHGQRSGLRRPGAIVGAFLGSGPQGWLPIFRRSLQDFALTTESITASRLLGFSKIMLTDRNMWKQEFVDAIIRAPTGVGMDPVSVSL
jgi:hypothetical protein